MGSYLKAFLLSLLLTLTACETTIPQNEDEQQASLHLQPEILKEQPFNLSDKRQIGILLPLTGTHAEIGKSLRQAIELGFFENPVEGVELLFKDTEGSAQGALKGAQACLNENVEALIGPLFAAEVKAIKPLFETTTIPLLVLSNDRSLGDQRIFTLGFSPQAQVNEIITYASRQNLARIAALLPATPYGTSVGDELKKLAQEKKITLVALIRYEGHGENIKKDLTHLKQNSYDALFIAAGGAELTALLKNLTYYEFDYHHHPLLGTALLENMPSSQELMGATYATPTPESYKTFEDRFASFYGVPPKRMASLGYDAIIALTHTMKQATDKAKFFKILTHEDGFFGANGFFRLKDDGSNERKLFVYRLTQDGPQLIKTLL